jgi:hypothetical protein
MQVKDGGWLCVCHAPVVIHRRWEGEVQPW